MNCEELAKLVEAVQSNKKGAFEKLYRYSLPYVYHHMDEYGIRYDEKADIAQEVFLQIIRSIHSLQDPMCYIKWLNMIIRAKCCNHIRKKKDRLTHLDEEVLKEDEVWIEQIEQVERREIIEEILARLDHGYRQVLTLKYLREMSEKEIAACIHVPRGTVKSRLYLARQQAQKLCAGGYVDRV